jgi:TPP-dependent pyruvate/acetoin dehydrogenase alpha subunit
MDLAGRAGGYGMPAASVDGMDVRAVEAAAVEAAGAVREGGGPRFLELQTYRFRAHSMYDPELYRTKAEVDEWRQRDPIPAFVAVASAEGLLEDGDLAAIEAEVAAELDDAIAFAEAGHPEPVEDLTRFVMAEAGS